MIHISSLSNSHNVAILQRSEVTGEEFVNDQQHTGLDNKIRDQDLNQAD